MRLSSWSSAASLPTKTIETRLDSPLPLVHDVLSVNITNAVGNSPLPIDDDPRCALHRTLPMHSRQTYEGLRCNWAASPHNEALERNVCSLMKRTIVACIGVGDKHRANVSLIGRFLLHALYQRRVGDA